MRTEAFIPDWPGEKQHAAQLANTVARFCPTRILDDPDDYFNAQWEKARAQATGDILFWCMADVILPTNFVEMYSGMEQVMGRGDVGWWAPDIAWTCYVYDKKDLWEVQPDVYQVPNTDSLCFAIRKDVIEKMPHIDPSISFMWGMDFLAIATARLMGLKTVRDYRFRAQHPNNTGYSIPKASGGADIMMAQYPQVLRNEIVRLTNESNRLKRLS